MTIPRQILERDIERQLRARPKVQTLPILEEAEVDVGAASTAAANAKAAACPVTLEQVDSAAVAVWRNEGDPN